MEKTVVRVYVDYKSPYAFVAVRPTYALAERYGLTLEWLPYTLRIGEYLGTVEERNAHQWRRVKYSYMDARRLANEQGLTLKGPERVFEAYYSSAGMLFAKRHGLFEQYHHTVFDRFWKRALDLDSRAAIAEVIGEIGGDAAAFEAYAEAEGREEHRALIEEAEAMGVFGVPMYVLDGELFWGGDRLPMLTERLEARGLAPSGGKQGETA